MIEPDRENIKTLNKYLFGLEPSLRERISIHPNAVSDSNTRMAFRHEGGHGGSLDTKQLLPNEDFVDVVRLDDLLDESPTLIKMDIEGAELSALKGAAKIVTLAKPRLALSAYHRATDLLDLTELALKLNPNYRIGLRHHTEDRWDTCLYFF
jgi:FkbM family methyltransferase